MSAWKRDRGWMERHGWGPEPLARWIGRQRREARRTGTIANASRSIAERLAPELSEALKEETTARDLYEGMDLKDPAFWAARDLWNEAFDRLEALKAAARST